MIIDVMATALIQIAPLNTAVDGTQLNTQEKVAVSNNAATTQLNFPDDVSTAPPSPFETLLKATSKVARATADSLSAAGPITQASSSDMPAAQVFGSNDDVPTAQARSTDRTDAPSIEATRTDRTDVLNAAIVAEVNMAENCDGDVPSDGAVVEQSVEIKAEDLEEEKPELGSPDKQVILHLLFIEGNSVLYYYIVGRALVPAKQGKLLLKLCHFIFNPLTKSYLCRTVG